MAKKSISQLDSASAVTTTDLFEVAVVNALSESGYESKKQTIGDLENHVGNTATFSGLNTTDKTLVGAINEAAQSGGSSGSSYSTIEHEVGTWVDGSTLYEKTYVWTTSDLQNSTISSSIVEGYFFLDLGSGIDKIWLDSGSSFTWYSGSSPNHLYKSVPVILTNFSGSKTLYAIYSNILQVSDINNGNFFIYYKNSLNSSEISTETSNWTWYYTFRYTKTSV